LHVGVIFCDVAQAFDCVNHEVLLARWDLYGTEG
jgi:hypothetical protein